jgi:tetratricopeptide (TPR) repeat protein
VRRAASGRPGAPIAVGARPRRSARRAVALGAAALSTLAFLLFAPSRREARADTPPGVWDLARDPVERDRWNLHLRVRRLLRPPISDDILPPELRRDQELRFEAARAMLEEADAAHSPDVRLRFDLGIVYQELASQQHRSDLDRRAIDVLAPALDAEPDHPAATEALASLVYAYAKLDLPREELAAWRRLIPRLRDDSARVSPLMNMGEAEMRLGHLDDAVGTFRSVLQVCGALPNSSSRNSIYALTLWDLAVALDRSGDPRAALDTAVKAGQMRWAMPGPPGLTRERSGWDEINSDPSVFFVPSWEREWYLALGTAAFAREEREPRASATLLAQSEGHWDIYLARAEASPGDSRWLPLARIRRQRVHAARLAAEERASHAGARPGKNEASLEEHAL